MRACVVAALLCAIAGSAEARDLRVCADPNNLPFSNKAGQGFENRIADHIAHDLHAHVTYVWWPQRRGFIRNTLKNGRCDVWPGVAAGMPALTTTAPYYRSSYVFVTRATMPPIAGFDDPRLRQLRIGVQMIGNDATNTPPAHALARRGMTNNVRGYMLYGDYTKPNPPAEIITAVARGDIDVAVAWGPLAGYFAARAPQRLRLTPVTPAMDGQGTPMQFGIAMGVRKGDVRLVAELNQALRQDQRYIVTILASYHVPVLKLPL